MQTPIWTLDKVDVGQVGNLPGRNLPRMSSTAAVGVIRLRYVFVWLQAILELENGFLIAVKER